MENYHPNQVHQEQWRSTYMQQSHSKKQHRKGKFSQSLAGRHYTDGSLDAHKRRVEQESRQKKRLATLAEHTKNVAKLQEEALEVQAELEEIQHRNRLKAERAERRRQRHQQFCAARIIQNNWRCRTAYLLVENTRKYARELAATILQRIWRRSSKLKIKARVQEHKMNAVNVLIKWFRNTLTKRKFDCSAIKFQALVRSLLARKKVHKIKFQRIQVESATIIQAVMRGHKIRLAAAQQSIDDAVDSSDSTFVTTGVVGMSQVKYVNKQNVNSCDTDQETVEFEFSAPTTLMPKLSLSELPKGGQTYHEEFMSHSNEFSKSWREQLEEEEERFDLKDNIINDENEDEAHICDTSRTDGGTVVETIRNLRLKRNHQKQRPQSSPVKRTTGPAHSKRNTIKRFRPAYKSRKLAFVDQVMETRKAAMAGVAALEERRMAKLREKVKATAEIRKMQERES
jgi:hypothetical protein